ncbi:MAG: hypothetical protein QOH05_591 [Acetobacteraceae bacterium]|nr:hypothetical protein [Acetobacteraceae bacterium]
MDSRSRLDEAPTRASNSSGTDREERLLRFADKLRSAQLRESTAASAEGGRTGFRRWFWRGLLLAVVVVVVGDAAVFLRTSGPSHLRRDATPDSAVGTVSIPSAPQAAPAGQQALPPKKARLQPPADVAEVDAPAERPVNPVPVRPAPEALSLSSSHRSAPGAEQRAADPPNKPEVPTPDSAVTTAPKSIEPAPRREADAVPSPPSTVAAADVSGFETVKPVLWVYYPRGSSRAEASARSLAAGIGSNLTSSDFKTGTDSPNDAVIKFSEERNHVLARMIGKSLGVSGYRWKIENTSSSGGSHRNIIEVWLPMK